MATLYGVPVSPYVRKAMLAHEYKGMSYELKMTAPGGDDPEFNAASPLKKIPAYKTDAGVYFADSSVIVAYLEKKLSDNALYPTDADLYGKALWLEEYCDTKMSESVTALYFQRVLGPKIFKHETDANRVNELITTLIPEVLNYIESELTESEWVINDTFSIADLAIGMNVMSLHHADYQIDATQWPKLVDFEKRFMALDIVAKQLATEKASLAHHDSK